MAIGGMSGRSGPGADWTDARELAAKLRSRFVNQHKTTQWGALLDKFGIQTNMIRCKKLSGEVAGMLAAIWEERGRAWIYSAGIQCFKNSRDPVDDKRAPVHRAVQKPPFPQKTRML